jgi:colicin import membrane protein
VSTELAAVSAAVAEFDRVAAGLAELEGKYKGVVYEVATTKGMNEAKEARRAIREPRIEVEKIRKSAKAPILALGKKLDTEAARITKALEELECPIDDQIKSEEARREEERQAKIAAELKRVADLQERIAELRGCPNLSPTSGSILISDHIQDLEEIIVDSTFQEFEQQARDAKAAGLARLRDLHAAALAHEAEQERLRLEREELARLRAEQARREDEERARLAEEERRRAEQRAKEEAEAAQRRAAEEEALRKAREALEAQARAERERIAEEARQERARQQTESERIIAEEAAARARQLAEEQRLADERAAFEAQKAAQEPEAVVLAGAPTHAQVVEVIAEHYKVSIAVAEGWLWDILEEMQP